MWVSGWGRDDYDGLERMWKQLVVMYFSARKSLLRLSEYGTGFLITALHRSVTMPAVWDVVSGKCQSDISH
jgi:hypothetical protein